MAHRHKNASGQLVTKSAEQIQRERPAAGAEMHSAKPFRGGTVPAVTRARVDFRLGSLRASLSHVFSALPVHRLAFIERVFRQHGRVGLAFGIHIGAVFLMHR